MGIEVDRIHKDDVHLLEEFECIVCRQFPDEPKECQTCKKHFCHECISEWTQKNQTCPIKCKPTAIVIVDLNDEERTKYNGIRTLCTKNCGKFVPLGDFVDHITLCNLPDCTPTCGRKVKYVVNGFSTCSYNCFMTNNPDAKSDPDFDPAKVKADCPNVDLSRTFPVIWDRDRSSKELTLTGVNGFKSTSSHNEHQTVVSKVGLLGGLHRYEFRLGKSENPVKVGITKDPNVPVNTAFSDFEPGFAFYTVGATRNDNNGSGMLYGVKCEVNVENKIKMEVSMGEGKMKFSMNERCFGSAFDGDEVALQEGPMYIAVAVRKVIEETKVDPVNSM